MRFAFTIGAFCFFLFAPFCWANQLETIKHNLETQRVFNSSTVGATISGKISISINVDGFPLTNISATITPKSLSVTAKTDIWDQHVDVQLYFFYAGSDLELTMSFDSSGSFGHAYKRVLKKHPPSILSGLTGSDTIKLVVSTAAQGSIKEGVSASATATITGGDLLKAAQVLQSGLKTVGPVSASLYIPVFGSSPEDIQLSVTESGTIKINKDLSVESISFDLDVPNDLKISAKALLLANGPGKSTEKLTFSLSADFSPSQQTTTFKGDMSGDWHAPFGLDWLNVTNVDITMKIGPGFNLQLNGQADLSFSKKPVDVEIVFGSGGSGSTNMEDILFSVTNIPLSKGFTDIFETTSHKSAPKLLSQVEQSSGVASLSISTFADGNIKEGLTLTADVTVTEESPVLKASRVLKKDATPSTFKYDMSLYIPVFNNALDVEFSFVETGTSFNIFNDLSCKSYTIDVTLGAGDSSFSINADVFVHTKQETVEFDLEGKWQESSEEVTFSGTLVGSWNHPLGLKWLDLTAGSITLTLGGTSVFDSLTIKATGSLSFLAGKSVAVVASLGGQQLGDVFFAIENFPIDTLTLGLLYIDVLGESKIPPEIAALNPTGDASIALGTYAANGYQEGFTLTADITIEDTGDIYKAARVLVKDPSSFTYNLKFYIPLFSSSPLDVTLDISETGAFKLDGVKTLVCDGYHLDVSLSPTDTTINIGTTLTVDLRHNSESVEFSLSAAFSEASESVTFSGNLVSDWKHPFDIRWITLDALTASLSIGPPAGIQSFSISGTGNFTVGSVSSVASLSFSLDDDFEDATLSAQIANVWTLAEIVEEAMGTKPSAWLRSVVTDSKMSLDFSISTLTGISVSVNGDVVDPLRKDLNDVTYWWKNTNMGNITFAVSVDMTLFSGEPSVDLKLAFAEAIPVSRTITFESVTFSLDAATDSSIALSTKLKAKWKRNPVVYFNLGGKFTTDGSVLLDGDMIGTWEDPFGVKGFNLSNVIIEFGLNPSMCAVDACISDIGLGFIMAIGSTTIQFDGNVAAPDWEDIFMKGKVTGKHGMALTVLDVAKDWNRIVPFAPVDTSVIPPTWGLDDAGFWFATSDGQFGNIQYVAGFGITGGIVILDMSLYLSINCTDGMGFECNFAFDVDVTKDKFTNMIKQELNNCANCAYDVFTLNKVALTNWSQKHVSKGVNPHWSIGLTILDGKHDLEFNVHQYELASSFHSFFQQWLAHVFGDVDNVIQVPN